MIMKGTFQLKELSKLTKIQINLYQETDQADTPINHLFDLFCHENGKVVLAKLN